MAQITINVPDTEEIRGWKVQASQLQSSFYNTYRDKIWWSGIPDNNINQLQHMFGQIIFGHPPTDAQEDLKKSGYKRVEIHRIKFITKRVLKHFKNETSMSVILVCAKLKRISHTEQVFRVWDSTKEYFIDGAGRVYKNWDAFLNENLYLQSLICYPAFGIYKINVNDEVLVDYRLTPACNPKRRRTAKLDIISIIIYIISTILFIVAAVTGENALYIAGAVLALIGLPYSFYRAYSQLRDAYSHL